MSTITTAQLGISPRTVTASSSDVAHQLIRLVTSGGLRPGERLPPERRLQQQLAVGRSAIREALAALALLGLVEIRPGSGTYVRESSSALLPAALSWGMMLNGEHIDELLDLRTTLEVRAAAAAATRMTEADDAELHALLDRMEAAKTNLPAFIEADAAFHRLVAERAGNSVLRDLLGSVNSLLRVWVERAAHTSDQLGAALREHSAIAVGLQSRDAEIAAAAMRMHMRTATARLAGSAGR